MKKLLTILAACSLLFTLNSFAAEKEKKVVKKVVKKKDIRPNKIDKNNVGITSDEKPDQTDPTLIEGNLEDNDFKN